LLQYIYKPDEAGLTEWPSGTLRLEDIPVTENPAQADIFVYPGPLHLLRPDDLASLRWIKDHEERHVFFHNADHEDTYGRKCMFIRCNLRPFNFGSDPNSIVWPWAVDDLSNIQHLGKRGNGVEVPEDIRDCVAFPPGGFKYDVSFHGWNSCLVRKVSAVSCQNNRNISADIKIHSNFFGYLEETPEGIQRRKDFLRSIKESRMVLCPESIPGVLPYRFFEAMSAGRYPVLIGRDYSLPFADEIPYDSFISKIDRDRADEAGDIIAEIRSRHTDAVFQAKGRMARKYFVTYLDSRFWPRMMAYAVIRKMKQLGLTKESSGLNAMDMELNR
jgi:hypothetical protein